LVTNPTAIRLEATSSCQLRCPECPTTQGIVHRGVVGRGVLTVDRFRALLDLNPSLAAVELSNWGEAFLNRELPALLAAAHERGVAVTISNGVNLNDASEAALDAVVRYQVRHITVSIDGATQAVYETYRVGGDLARVLANVRRINELKEHYATALPRLTWQFVIFGHNEHEISAARRLATELGMSFAPKLNWSPDYSPPRDRAAIEHNAGVSIATVAEHRRARGEYLPSCLQLWEEPQVNWDGKILGCCVNTWSEFGGNAFAEPIERWFESDRLRHARATLTGNAPARDDVPCSSCEVFARIKESGRWIDPNDADVQRAARAGDHAALAGAIHRRLKAARSRD
jgi:MoaA/NifB/PqqE/SkfB family radical SAM enzyme